MIQTQIYQRILLALLFTILLTNFVTIWDNWQTRRITDETFDKVIEILQVPPSEVYKAVQKVQSNLDAARVEQRQFQEEIKAR